MTSILNVIKKTALDYFRRLSGEKINEYQAEDPISKTILNSELCRLNSERIVMFSFFAVILCAVFLIAAVLNISGGDIVKSIMSVSGLLIIIFGGGLGAGVIFKEYSKRKHDIKKLSFLICVFWFLFSIGFMLITVADFSPNVFFARFFLYLTVMALFPLFKPRLLILITAPYLFFVLIFGIIFKADFITLILISVFFLAYLVISSLVYDAHCCLVITDRRLDIDNERLKQMKEKDSLTGLLNKKAFIKRLTDIIDKGAYKNIAAVFFDIDDFREYNKSHTDKESDACLYGICNCIKITAKSKTDIVSRYGEDKFVLIVQNISEYDLISFAEQLRKSVERMALSFDKSGKTLTVSVGVSSITEGAVDDYSLILKEADDNLYLAKKGGKNCVGYMKNVFKANG